MPQNYLAWPTYQQIQAALTAAGIPLRSGTADAYYTAMVDAVVADLQNQTKRQFVADETSSERHFSGNNTGELEVDDIVELTSVELLWWNGVNNTTITNAVLLDEKPFARNKIIIAYGPSNIFPYGILSNFPEGRGNIVVDAVWGYGQYIPDDVWIGVRDRVCSKIAANFLTDSASGRVIHSWVEGASSEKYKDKLPGEALGWDLAYKRLIMDYMKPASQRIKVNKKSMI